MGRKIVWKYTILYIALLFGARLVLPHLSLFEHDPVFSIVIVPCILAWLLFFVIYQLTGAVKLITAIIMPICITLIALMITGCIGLMMFSPQINTIVFNSYFITSGIITVLFILTLFMMSKT